MVDRGGTNQRLATALAGVGLAIAVGGCTGASPSPTATTEASGRESSGTTPSAHAATPTPGFEAPTGVLPPNSRAVVTLDGLRIREAPGLDAAVVDTLSAGTVVILDNPWGPIAADGIDWYQVHDDLRAGFAAAGADGDRYLELVPPRCEEEEPDLAALQRITAWERLACFGDQSLTFTGTYGCPVCGIAYPNEGSYAPHWLASPDSLAYLGDTLILRFAPEAGLDGPPNASIVRVTGHFSDLASTTCVIDNVPGQRGVPVDPVNAQLYCREQFVVDAYQIIGTDPDFTYSPAP